jgi:hypothetical protein
MVRRQHDPFEQAVGAMLAGRDETQFYMINSLVRPSDPGRVIGPLDQAGIDSKMKQAREYIASLPDAADIPPPTAYMVMGVVFKPYQL